jgi:class 3 adenylate cyclase
MFGSLHERANNDRPDEAPTSKHFPAQRGNNDEIQALIVQGAKMLGAWAYLMLLVPDKVARVLRCIAYYPSPTMEAAIQVSIDPSHSPQMQGIAGHLYLNPERLPKDNLYDHVSVADGKEGRPHYVDCLKDVRVDPFGMGSIEQNYAVIVPSLNSSEPLGILLAEASADILEKERDLPLLETIARACQKTLLQQKANDEEAIFLKTLLPSHIVEQLGSSKDGKSWVRDPEPQRITILNADIRGYTRMSEIVGEANMLTFQKDYFKLVVNAVHEHRGNLDKFMGDGVMALFDYHRREWDKKPISERESEDEPLVKDVIDAVNAGMKIAAEFKTLSETWLPIWRKRHVAVLAKHRFTIGVAIHCGNPITGLFRTDSTDGGSLPSAGHTTYTIMGRDANLGARVCGAVRNNSVWVTAPCRELLLQQRKFRDRLNESVRLDPDVQIDPDPEENEPDAVKGKMKGIPHPIDIFKIQQTLSRPSRRRRK